MRRQAAIATPASADERERAERLPEPLGERDRRRGIVLEPEPPGLREPLHALDVVPCAPAWSTTNGLVSTNARPRARPPRQAAPLAEARDHERHDEHAPGYFAGGGEPGGDARPLEPTGDEERERHRDPEREQHVRDGHPRVGDVGRRDRDADRADGAREASVAARPSHQAAATPRRRCRPRRRGPPRTTARRRSRPAMARARGTAGSGSRTSRGRARPVDELPRARDDVLLVRVEQRQRQPESRADRPKRGGDAEDQPERDQLDGRGPSAARRPPPWSSDVRNRVADERLDVARDEHGIDAGALELLDVLAARRRRAPRSRASRRGRPAAARGGGRAEPARRPPAPRSAGGSPGRRARARGRARRRRSRGRRTRSRARDSAPRARRAPRRRRRARARPRPPHRPPRHPAVGRTRAAAGRSRRGTPPRRTTRPSAPPACGARAASVADLDEHRDAVALGDRLDSAVVRSRRRMLDGRAPPRTRHGSASMA